LGKGIPTDKQIEHFTVGNDRELDLFSAKYDALGSIAHQMLENYIDSHETDIY
jgi:argininosuccinate lyase